MKAALEWGTASAPIPGETVLGDRAVVRSADERALLATVDGVGHGPEAAAAAHIAASVLEHSAEHDLVSAVFECHRALVHTRGAALSLASIDYRKRTMTWLGIGNVEARLLRGAEPLPAAESLLLHGGIVGHDLPRVSCQTTPVARGDVVIFATDGIRRDFADGLVPSGSCREIADHILSEHTHGSDDALVLVARYLGRP
jgi:serine phosphatase RsbU (regulator of sigma subunit)